MVQSAGFQLVKKDAEPADAAAKHVSGDILCSSCYACRREYYSHTLVLCRRSFKPAITSGCQLAAL